MTQESLKNPKPVILVAEDDKVYQKLYLSKLTKCGFDVDIVDNGLKAIEKIRSKEKKYCVVLMDLSMPVLDGYDAVSIIRSDGNDIIPVLAVTANTDQLSKEKCIRAGFNGFISKPVKIMELLSQIQNWVDMAVTEEKHEACEHYANAILHKEEL